MNFCRDVRKKVCSLVEFWLRFISFSLLWIFYIASESRTLPFSILVFSVAIGVYFFLSLKKGLLVLYLFLSLLVCGHSLLLTGEAGYSVLIIFFLSFDAARLLNKREHIIYVIGNMFFIFFIMAGQKEISIETVVLYLLFLLLFITVNRLQKENEEKRELYEQLLDEYRKLKRLSRAAEQDARLEERNKIARDIHDSVGHRLTALMMKLEMLSIREPKLEFEDLKKMARESLEETRLAVKAIEREENEGIATIVQLIRKLEAESHLRVNFTLKQGVLSIPLSNEKNVVLYRVIQESLTNAMRHTQSRKVTVTLGVSAAGDLSFEISNPIFEPKPFTFGFGLTNMKKRVEQVKGMIHVYQTEKEFVVSGTIPREAR